MYPLYRVLYFLAFCFYFPYLLGKTALQGKSFRVLFKHLFPEKIELKDEPKSIIWAHAVSVGEVVAIAPVLAGLVKKKEKVQIILSTVTETGFATAKKLVPEAIHVYYPFDFSFSVRRVLGTLTPSLVLLSEGDVWPVFLQEMKKRKAFVSLINGKMSDRSFGFFQKVPSLSKWLYGSIDLFCVQNDRMKERWEQLGIPGQNISVTGNTKTDTPPKTLSEVERNDLRNKLGVEESDHVIVLGSTHYPEEDKLTEALHPLIQTDRTLKVIVVPRHPERACEVCETLQRRIAPDNAELLSSGKKDWRILVVDELGGLTNLYQIAHVAIVCGSFVERIGGHNIFEPAVFGVPTIVGPYMHAQKALFESALRCMAVIQVGYPDLSIVVRELFRNEEVRNECSCKARAWAESLRGATEKTISALLERKAIS